MFLGENIVSDTCSSKQNILWDNSALFYIILDLKKISPVLPECIKVQINAFDDIWLGYERHEKQKEYSEKYKEEIRGLF